MFQHSLLTSGERATHTLSIYTIGDGKGGEGVPYGLGLQWQRELQGNILSGEHPTSSALVLLEHSPPVYTLGRRAKVEHIVGDVDEGGGRLRARCVAADADTCVGVIQVEGEQAEIHRIERGGEVTWHGPGQLVGYSIVDLAIAPMKKDLHWYLRQIEEVLIRSLARLGIEATRHPEYTGVWVDHGGPAKIAAVGLSVSKWVTMHGFAINVRPDLAAFHIVPCGISFDETGRKVVSISIMGGVHKRRRHARNRRGGILPVFSIAASTAIDGPPCG